MQRKRQEKVKKGCLVVWVGCEQEDEEMRRFTIPISHLYHPQFRMLLEKAKEVYGFRLPGPLKLPCSVDDFLHLQWLAGRESALDENYHVRHKHLSNSLSFRSC